ncbi:membrane protein insertion efficiency factor YidD [Paenibacillus kandeliae]|uniref:membrane protein insertion efficiency factor YidD n=1 Tax=Paenibacillus kandeliae TaxID=3231269 RepID=UPI003F533329
MSRRAVQVPIHFYRKFISPLKPPSCRFYPTCSQYALEAIEVHGVLKGSWLAARRISKCHPFHPGGIDLVPPPRSKRQDVDHEPEHHIHEYKQDPRNA